MHKAMLVCREGGLIAEIRRWWDTHNTFGPDFDYLPIAKKCWIMAKPDTVESVRAAFEDTAVNVMVKGPKHPGAVISSKEHLEEYVCEKVTNWANEVTNLVEFALLQP